MKKLLTLLITLCVLLSGCGVAYVPATDPTAETAGGEELLIHFIDVGQADSSLIICDGQAMLIDAGNPGCEDIVLPYLEELGITHLHLLPVYDYGSVDESKLDVPQFNWGYDPVNYNVPSA